MTTSQRFQRFERIYLAIKGGNERSQTEDLLAQDGFDVSSSGLASEVWDRFQHRPARLIITDRRFGNDMSGLDLTRQVRSRFRFPYTYVIILSALDQKRQIEEGLAAGADDYIIRPHNKLQMRSRVLVAI